MYNKKSLENLKPFSAQNQPKKRGRRKGSLSIKNSLKKILAEYDEDTGRYVIELLAKAIVQQAMSGKWDYFHFIYRLIEVDMQESMLENIMARNKIPY